MRLPPPNVLTIAGSDCSGGAGIQADLKTLTALQVYGASVITALTAQNTLGVQAIHTPPTSFLAQQLSSVLSDIPFAAVKTGMLPTAPVIRTVAHHLRLHPPAALVVDPVLAATSGDALASGPAADELRRALLPLATLATPNVPEAAALTGRPIRADPDVRRACLDLVAMGCRNVLVKGGHAVDGPDAAAAATDVLYDGREFQAFAKPRLSARDTHGTGCTMAAAIAAEMAKGAGVRDAVGRAKEYVHEGIKEGVRVGQGRGPVNHMNAYARRLWGGGEM